MPKVYVINKSCHDLDNARRFGEIIYLSEGRIDRYATGKMYRLFNLHIRDSKPEDYILLTGLSVMQSIACSMFAAKHGRLNLLIHKVDSRGKHIYLRREVVLNVNDRQDGR